MAEPKLKDKSTIQTKPCTKAALAYLAREQRALLFLGCHGVRGSPQAVAWPEPPPSVPPVRPPQHSSQPGGQVDLPDP